MTALGTAAGAEGDWRWEWEIRALNGRGFDLKLRMPDGLGTIEPDLRRRAAAALSRGSVSASLRLTREKRQTAQNIDQDALRAHIALAQQAQKIATAGGVTLAQMSVGEILGWPGVLSASGDSADSLDDRVLGQISQSFDAALAALQTMRAAEGAGLVQLLARFIDEVETSCERAEELAPQRAEHQRQVLSDAVARVSDVAAGFDGARVTQEVALIAVKGDVSEELERLRLHISAARELLSSDGPVGRKLEFLTQGV